MLLYEYHDNYEGKIICKPIEVKETAKTYTIVETSGRFSNYSNRIRKDQIGTIIDKYCYAVVLTERDDKTARRIIMEYILNECGDIQSQLNRKRYKLVQIKTANIEVI